MSRAIIIASEHAGFALKNTLKEYLVEQNYEVADVGAQSAEPVDYPDIAADLCRAIVSGTYERGILICGTGIGMCVTACKVPGIRAALCTNAFMSKMAVMHNNANVLCLGSWITGSRLSMDIVEAFLSAAFEGGRHTRRIDRMAEIEREFAHCDALAARGKRHA